MSEKLSWADLAEQQESESLAALTALEISKSTSQPSPSLNNNYVSFNSRTSENASRLNNGLFQNFNYAPSNSQESFHNSYQTKNNYTKADTLINEAHNQAMYKGTNNIQNSMLLTSGESIEAPSRAEVSLLSKYLHTQLRDIHASNAALKSTKNESLQFRNGSGLTFEDLGLDPDLLKGIHGMGYHSPSLIQAMTLPIMLGLNKDNYKKSSITPNVIAQSPSGTGKTAAFAITMLSRVDTHIDAPQALCISPTFELALQTYEVIERMGRYIKGLKIGRALKGCPLTKPAIAGPLRGSGGASQSKLRMGDHVIVGTPGTLMELVRRRTLQLDHVTVFVLDEADVMLEIQGTCDSCIRINNMLPPSSTSPNDGSGNSRTPQNITCQRLLFSATFDPQVMSFARSIVPDAQVFSLEPPKLVPQNIRQFCVTCQDFASKLRALVTVYGAMSIGQSILFCDTKKQAGYLVGYLSRDAGFPIALLSSELDIERRAEVINRFREGQERLIVATNVLARGIDVEQVNLVVNFDIPTHYSDRSKADFETYLHRIGRCGRFGKKGLAINLLEPSQLPLLRQIEDHFGIKIPFVNLDKEEELEKFVLEND